MFSERLIKYVNFWDGDPNTGDAEYGSGKPKIRQADPSQNFLIKTKVFRHPIWVV